VTDTVPIYDPTKGTATPAPAALEPEETSGPTAPAVSAPGPLSPYPAPGEPLLTTDAEERVAVATQAQLMWRRFRKHRLAMLGAVAVILFYLVVLLADFLSYADPEASDAQRGLIAPQQVRLFLDGQFHPHVYAMVGERDPTTFKRVYTEDPTQIIPLTFFSPGFDYKLFGFIPTDRHLIGVEGVNPEETLFLLGTDLEGRDMWSRVMFATRTSLTIGLIAVVVSLVLGVILGGISGFYGGIVDTVIPLWMGLAAAMPKTWSITQVYFTITIIISLIGWTELARVVRGRFLSLREEDFVTAADLVGARQSRIIFVHMVPLFLSHIIAATTLALPAMIISETALSFLGLGLRPPAISWGVLLQQAQNVQTVALSPWLLLPALPVILVILAFNFLGDGLRDAADPYS
jgi:peptide/nickel transport system permease protein